MNKYSGRKIIPYFGVYTDNCEHCKKDRTPEGHDGCLGELSGVMNACCGHGRTNEAYIQFPNTTTINGQTALNILKIKRNIRNVNIVRDD